MAVTYGFYDSLSGDRKYNAEQMSRIFEGIILDGVFGSVGGAFAVTAATAMNVNVATGRAWFAFTWTLNDSNLLLTVEPSEVALNRIDTVVIEVNKDLGVRANSIKIIKGTPASSPVAPTLANTSTLKQYGLANIYVAAGVTQIVGGNITNRVGTTDTPFVTGPLSVISAEDLLNQYSSEFDAWFINLQNQLDANQASNLQNQINEHTYDILAYDNILIVPDLVVSDLTLSIKARSSGVFPTQSNPIYIRVGDVRYKVTTNLSFTVSSGTNWCNLGSSELAGQTVDMFVYAIKETGATPGLKIGFSRIPYARYMSDFSSTSTNEKYLVSNVGTRNGGDYVQNIGRFKVRLGASPTYTWTQAPVGWDPVHFPIFQSDWSFWNPTYTGFSSNPNMICAYRVIGQEAHINTFLNSNGTSNLTTTSMTLPFANVVAQALVVWAGVTDSGVLQTTPGHARTAVAGSNLLDVYKTFFSGAWTNTGAKGFNFPVFSYRLK